MYILVENGEIQGRIREVTIQGEMVAVRGEEFQNMKLLKTKLYSS